MRAQYVMSCEFCEDVTRAGDLLFEDERAYVVLHKDWSPRGHAMIVAKQHVENACELDEAAWLQLARVWHRAAIDGNASVARDEEFVRTLRALLTPPPG